VARGVGRHNWMFAGTPTEKSSCDTSMGYISNQEKLENSADHLNLLRFIVNQLLMDHSKGSSTPSISTDGNGINDSRFPD